jgi:hypothetical protein
MSGLRIEPAVWFVVLSVMINGGELPALADQRIDLVLNHGRKFTASRSIEIDPSGAPYPQLWLSLNDPSMKNREVLENPGKPFEYTLPDHDGSYNVFLRFADATGNPQGMPIFKVVELDRISPVVQIISPVEGSTTAEGFVHVQASVFDPAPPDMKGSFMHAPRRVAVWINGERFWNFGSVIFNATNIDIPRFPVQDGPNTLTIVAADEASNRTEAVVHWTVNLDLDKSRPALSDIQLYPDKSGKVILPDDPEVVVAGHLDDPNAIVTVTVNGGQGRRLTVLADKRIAPTPVFRGRLALDEGDNTVVFSAINGAGNASDYRYTVVRSNRYRFAITSSLGTPSAPMNSVPRIIEGYVSALRDAGTPVEAHLVSVFVNDVPTTLSVPDAQGNVHFQTTGPVPLMWHGYLGFIYARVKWSDGEEY